MPMVIPNQMGGIYPGQQLLGVSPNQMTPYLPGDPMAPLPAGWKQAVDPRTGRYYYINTVTKKSQVLLYTVTL